MPELPEVQTVVDTLKNLVLGKTISSIQVLYQGIIKTNYFDFTQNVLNQKICDIKRRGKYIVFVLSDYYLISHLRMEGKYFYKEKEVEITKHDHVLFKFENGGTLIYNDVRKFGTMELISKEVDYLDYIKIGIEPLSENYNLEYLKKIKSNKNIKVFLLDQTIVAGLGNIYVDEVLFTSKVNPTRTKNDLTEEELSEIVKNTKIILKKAIEARGTTIYSYTSSEGVTGQFQHELLVHTKVNKPCSICGNKIKKIKIGGRGTYLCETCQK